MTYDLTPEQQKLRDEVRDFADTVVAPAAYEYDTKRELPYEILAQMGEMGLFGLPFPVEYGGQGRDYVDLCLAVEQLGARRPVDRRDARGRASGSGRCRCGAAAPRRRSRSGSRCSRGARRSRRSG